MYLLRKITAKNTEIFPLKSKVLSIGRLTANNIVIDDKEISDVAARIEYDNGKLTIEALAGSKLFINGKKVKNASLQCGDKIEIGKSIFILEPDSSESENCRVQSSDSEKILSKFKQFLEYIGAERDIKKLMAKIIDSLFETIGGTHAFIFTIAPDGTPNVFVSSGPDTEEQRFSDTVVQQVLSSGHGICIPNTLSDPRYFNAQSIADLKLLSVLCCPMTVAQKNTGVIYLGSHNPSLSYTTTDLEILNIYARLAALLINHVEYISQQQSALKRLSEASHDGGVIAQSKAMQAVMAQLAAASQSDIPIIFQGETGTGKDILARLVHAKSKRGDKKFVVVNCSSLRCELLESELFGHKKGSFTGAITDHKGLFAEANGGTLFLDEIGEMDIALQAKLLRTLETGTIRPVGSSTEEKVDVRIICATNKDLEAMVSSGAFRNDLYYRLNHFVINLPPLRDREDDILLLSYYFLDKYRIQYPQKEIKDFHPDSLKAIAFYEWPGNIRELASIIHKGVLSTNGPLVVLDLPLGQEKHIDFEKATKDFQSKLIKRALVICGGNKEQAAKLLGVSRSTFFRYLSCSSEQTEKVS